MSEFKNIIVIGASAGGFPVLQNIIKGLDGSIDAAVVIVLHISRKSNSVNISELFQRHTSLKCRVAADGMALKKGYVYIAPPDHQLMVTENVLRVNQGPHENKYRPSIDVLFRSAAVNFGNRAIGVILTGLLEDGTSGMFAIKRTGGRCIVQNPDDAEYSDMPNSVLNKMEVDFKGSPTEISSILTAMTERELPPAVPIPEDIKIEAEITEKMTSKIDQLAQIADHSDFVCPECGGGLWSIKNDPVHRYRCHTGHVYTESLLHDIQEEKIEESIWVSIRMLEEKLNLLKLRANRPDEPEAGLYSLYQRRIDDTAMHINRLKKFLVRLNEDNSKFKPLSNGTDDLTEDV
ncbi:MAG TPA: chemotaxis protein CheB [Flavobacterium sp.]